MSRDNIDAVPAQQIALEFEQYRVSALLDEPPPPEQAKLLLVLAHGAGAGMRHRFIEGLVRSLLQRGVATLRYQFPYIEAGRRAPDRQPVLLATVRAALRRAARLRPTVPLLAGGKSMGGRMTSLLAARESLPGVTGLVFVGFPLHAPGRPANQRADHLARIDLPLLFLQGTRDRLADLSLMRPLCRGLGATLHVVDQADHSFAVTKRSGRTTTEVLDELALAVERWAAGAVR